ncbi:hypothetical protein LguiA_000604 [Lonicera macranthoides]
MVRELKEVSSWHGGSINEGGLGTLILFLWAALVTLSLISVIMLSCANGASKEKTSPDTYGTGCAAGCGAGCGG